MVFISYTETFHWNWKVVIYWQLTIKSAPLNVVNSTKTPCIGWVYRSLNKVFPLFVSRMKQSFQKYLNAAKVIPATQDTRKAKLKSIITFLAEDRVRNAQQCNREEVFATVHFYWYFLAKATIHCMNRLCTEEVMRRYPA